MLLVTGLEGMASSCARGASGLPSEVVESSSLEVFPEPFRCCTERCGLVRNIAGMWMVGLGDLGDLFQPWLFGDLLSDLVVGNPAHIGVGKR